MRHEYLMRSKAGNPAKDFQHMNASTVAPGIKSTGVQMRLQHAKGYEAHVSVPNHNKYKFTCIKQAPALSKNFSVIP